MDNSIASSTMAKSNNAGTNTASLTFADSTLTYGSIWGTSNSTVMVLLLHQPNRKMRQKFFIFKVPIFAIYLYR